MNKSLVKKLLNIFKENESEVDFKARIVKILKKFTDSLIKKATKNYKTYYSKNNKVNLNNRELINSCMFKGNP